MALINQGNRITKIFGINFKIDWNWLLILLLVVWNLSSAFSQVHPEWGTLSSISFGVAAALLFFLSVLLRELAHSLVAKLPGSEFVMAAMGPLTSLVIGFSLLLTLGVDISVEYFRELQLLNTLSLGEWKAHLQRKNESYQYDNHRFNLKSIIINY